MRRFFSNKIQFICYAIVFLFISLLQVLALSIPFESRFGFNNVWWCVDFLVEYPETIASFFAVVFFGLNILLYSIFYLLFFLKRHKLIIGGALSSSISTLAMTIIFSSFDLGAGFSRFCLVFGFIISLLLIGYYVLAYIFVYRNEEKEDGNIKKEKISNNQNIKALVITTVSIIYFIIAFFIPIFFYENKTNYLPIQALSTLNIPAFITFIVLFLGIIYDLILLTKIISNYGNVNMIRWTKRLVVYNFIFFIFYFLSGQITAFVLNLTKRNAYSVSYILFIIASAVYIIFSVLFKADQKLNTKKRYPIVEILIYTVVFSIIPLICLKLNMLSVYYNDELALSLNGYDILVDYMKLGTSYRLQAFIILTILIVDSSFLVLSLSAFFSRNKAFYKLSISSILFNSIAVLLVGLFSKYYEIIQSMNATMIKSILENYNIQIPVSIDSMSVSSQTIYMTIVIVVLLMILIITNPYKKLTYNNEIYNEQANKELDFSEKYENKAEMNENLNSFDPCPAFTEIDSSIKSYNKELISCKANQLTNPSLSMIANFVVEYARDSRLHLSYTVEDIATFIAGLGATKLSILQGMSGTGKTSLPKIFLEALMGNCEIVEVESSWRDKNELLGYYNEFSKSYTPKKFTQALYKASLNEERITFIVLDEMNLSRIEYYFSDFLSLMENEEDKREIKLLNTPIYRTNNGKIEEYQKLYHGHTLKIPKNVWFIGTANRDESTFEISDKVYDRANTMNFNKRAKKISEYGPVKSPRYLSYDDFIKALNSAKNNFSFDIDSCEIISEVEKILAPYNISYGNRIARQIENFVRIYCSCFTNGEAMINDAVERIILSKVVAKLENKSVENKDALIAQFNRLKLYKCSEFVSKLNED